VRLDTAQLAGLGHDLRRWSHDRQRRNELAFGPGGSLLVEANEVADCGEGVILFAADLIPD
jgi:hypothetical protein